MGSTIRGVLYCWLWYWSIYSGFLLLCCPIIPVMIVFPKTYQFLIGVIFSIWETYPTALMQLIFKTKIVLSGEPIKSGEKALIVMNHRTRCDWNFFWAGMYYAAKPPAHRLKMVLKAPIRKIPGPGWVMQIAGYLYIHRNWAKDQELMAKQLNYYENINDIFQLLIFPEGTDLTESTKQKSDKFAKANNLPQYTKVLHPRTTGFTFLVDTMRQNKQLEAVYDVTIAYPQSLPQKEVDLMKGTFPEQVHFHIKRYSEAEIPKEESLQIDWLHKIWKKKEETLINFYSANKFSDEDNYFKDDSDSARCADVIHNALYLSFAFWTGLQLIVVYLISFSSFFRWYAALFSIAFFIISRYTEGFQVLQINYFDFISRKFGYPKRKTS